MKTQSILFPRFTVDCYEGEVVDDNLCRYKIAIAASGVGFDQIRVAVFLPLVEGSILHNKDTDLFSIDADRPIEHPHFMSEPDARMVLLAAFRQLDLCRGYEDGFIISIPIVLGHWTREFLPLAVADDTERALLAAVMLKNSVHN
jgi:hypothetical protein